MLDATQLMGWVGGSYFLLLAITQAFRQWRSKISQCYPNPYKEERGIFVLERFTEFQSFRRFKIIYGHGLGVRTRKTKAFGRTWERCAANTSENTTPHQPQQKKQLKTKDWCCGHITKLMLV